jgi:CRISPR-associated protein Cas1
MSKILQSKRGCIIYLERSRVYVEDGRVVHLSTSDGENKLWNVPHVNTSVLLMGQGSSITQEAIRKLAEERVLIAVTGTSGSPIFMGSCSEYAPTEHLQEWINRWPDARFRLSVAKLLARERVAYANRAWGKKPFQIGDHPASNRFLSGIEATTSIEALRGYEGDYAKAGYAHVAKAFGVPWLGRTHNERRHQDGANRFLDQGNYLAYGLAGVVLWTLGIPPGLAVSHGATRAGGLVFDLADVVKDACILPRAFQSAAQGVGSTEYRACAINDLHVNDALPHLFDVFIRALRAPCK